MSTQNSDMSAHVATHGERMPWHLGSPCKSGMRRVLWKMVAIAGGGRVDHKLQAVSNLDWACMAFVAQRAYPTSHADTINFGCEAWPPPPPIRAAKSAVALDEVPSRLVQCSLAWGDQRCLVPIFSDGCFLWKKTTSLRTATARFRNCPLPPSKCTSSCTPTTGKIRTRGRKHRCNAHCKSDGTAGGDRASRSHLAKRIQIAPATERNASKAT